VRAKIEPLVLKELAERNKSVNSWLIARHSSKSV